MRSIEEKRPALLAQGILLSGLEGANSELQGSIDEVSTLMDSSQGYNIECLFQLKSIPLFHFKSIPF